MRATNAQEELLMAFRLTWSSDGTKWKAVYRFANNAEINNARDRDKHHDVTGRKIADYLEGRAIETPLSGG